MKAHCQVAVIGGGVVGCSILYHLTKLGWRDVVLIERKELTAGSTWHAAGGFHSLNSDPNVARLQSYTIALYKEIEQESGQSVGMHMTGGLNIAATRARWEFLRADHARHRVIGLETELVGPEEIKRMCPLIDVTDVLGAIFDPHEGHVDTNGATNAYAKAAKANGAEVYRYTRVVDLKPTGKGSWRVITDLGDIEAEHVVNAAGLWGREVGAMVGVTLPFVPMEHHYLITDELSELAALSAEIPLILDLDAEIYMRQEQKSMLVGVYEKQATPYALDGMSWEYGENELLPPHLERLTDSLLKGYERFPAVADAGIRRIVNGPFTFTPDGNPLVGPVAGVPNYWVACGVLAGFAMGGGIGLALSQWIIQGEPVGEILAMDVARFGDYAGEAWVIDKASEFYGRRFQIAYPNEYWPAGRPSKVDALYDSLLARNAVFGVSYGMEMPLFFAPPGTPPTETPALRRSNAFETVAKEVKAVQEGVGVFDSSSFAKYEISGPHAAEALDRIVASRLPSVGRIRLAPILSESGHLMGDLTVMRLAEQRFLVFGSGYLQAWHTRWFMQQLRCTGVTFRNVTDQLQGIQIVGPRARELLQRLTRSDVSNAALPFMAVRELDIGLSRSTVARLSLSGELTYEIYAPATQLRSLYQRTLDAGRDLGMVDFGVYALLSMRIEKSFGIWSREFSRDYTAAMCGLDRFIDFAKPVFIGREAALREREVPPSQILVTFTIDATDAEAAGYEPILRNDRYVGFTTSGAYGHRVGKSIAMGYIDRESAEANDGFEIPILGERRPAQLVNGMLYDPRNTLPRT
jgi:dimethylglycine dehydrogenase